MEYLTRPEHLLPSSFEERGASVPFTTPALVGARVRRDEAGRLELLIPGFSGNTAILVVPWLSLPEVVTLTVHDAILHDTITLNRAADPVLLRKTGLRVAAKGLAGPEAGAAAQKSLKDDEIARTFAHLLLIARIVEADGQGQLAAMMQEVGTPAGQKRIRGRLIAAARRLTLEIEALDARLEDLSRVAAPMGLSWGIGEGRLRGNLEKLRQFKKSLELWAQRNSCEASGGACYAADLAHYTIGLVEALVARYDAETALLSAVVLDWPRRAAFIARLVERVTWLLDGWDVLAAWWASSATKSLGEQITTLNALLMVLPMVPRDETQQAGAAKIAELAVTGRKWVRANVNWRTGQPDPEMVRRLEGMKAQLS